MSNDEKKVQLFHDDEETIVLTDDKGNDVEFYCIACVELDDEFFMIMQPAEECDDFEDDEVAIFRLQADPDDPDYDLYLPLESEEQCEKVFQEYMRAVADLQEEEEE